MLVEVISYNAFYDVLVGKKWVHIMCCVFLGYEEKCMVRTRILMLARVILFKTMRLEWFMNTHSRHNIFYV